MRQHLSELTLAIDIGSTNHKLALIDEQLTTVFSAHRPIETSRQGERVEFSVEALEQNINLMLLEALQYLTAQKQPIKINACGITGQRSTVVFWDERGSLAPAISWQDLRTAESIRSLEPHRQEITDRSGLALTAHYSGSKLRWGLDHLPAVKQAYEKCTLKWGPVTTYLIWRLTQGKVYKIDHTQAQRTQLLNYRTRHWDQKLCNYFRIPSDLLPPLTTSFAN
jgi:glycerol kinase